MMKTEGTAGSVADKVRSESTKLGILTLVKTGSAYALPVAIAAIWGSREAGIYGYLESSALMISSIAALGLERTFGRYVPIWQASGSWSDRVTHVGHALILTAVAAGLISVLTFGAEKAGLIGRPELKIGLVVLLITAVPLTAVRVLGGVFEGLKKPARGMAVGMSGFYMSCLLMVIVVGTVYNPSPSTIIICVLAASVLCLVLTFGTLRFTIASGSFVSRMEPKHLTSFMVSEYGKYGLVMVGVSLVNIVSARFDKIVLSNVVTSDVLGRYYIVALTAGVVSIIPRMSSSIITPIISEYHAAEDYKRQNELFRLNAKCASFLGFPLAALLAIVYLPAVEVIGVPSYEELYTAFLAILVGRTACLPAANVDRFVSVTGGERGLFIINVFTGGISVVALWGMGQVFGVIGVGAAIGGIVVLYHLALYFYARTSTGLRWPDIDYVYLIVLTLFVVGIGQVVADGDESWPWLVAKIALVGAVGVGGSLLIALTSSDNRFSRLVKRLLYRRG